MEEEKKKLQETINATNKILEYVKSTIAGVIGKRGYAKSVLFDYPYGICFHPQLQVVFVSDRASALRKVSLVNGKNMS